MTKIPSHIKNRIIILIHDITMIVIAWLFAYLLYYNLSDHLSRAQVLQALMILPILMLVQIFYYWYFGLYRGLWRFASVPDLIRIIKAVGSACLTVVLFLFLFNYLIGVPRSAFPLYGMFLVMLLGGARLVYRYIKEYGYLKFDGKRVLIIGAGRAGDGIVRDLLRDKEHYHAVAIVDDSPRKQGKEVHGVRVVGTVDAISRIVKEEEIELAIIAIPSARAREMQKIVVLCGQAGVAFRTVPGLKDLANGFVSVNSLREVALEDLLGREQIELDWKSIQTGLIGRTVLVSGGGGSIGSELCRQIARLGPRNLIVIEHSEYNLHQLTQEIQSDFPNLKYVPYLGDITNSLVVNQLMKQYQPDIVFHAAAYKHVPILENQIYSAIRNNVLGTKVLADASEKAGVKKFILISTDKAVRPTNVMGTTKRAAEIFCQLKTVKSNTQFITVRFGNVLGSSGSVVPLFKKQLAEGGPLTVTHPEVTRFFMMIPEAVSLIMQAAVLGEGGEIFVLDMGEQIKISYLAEQIIRLAGLEPETDIKIIYTGLRPGEKLYEELFYKEEEITRTQHEKIFQANSNGFDHKHLIHTYEKLFDAIHAGEEDQMYQLLKNIVPEFTRQS